MADLGCPTREALTALLLGTLTPEEEESVTRHLEECAACEAQAQELERRTDPLIEALRQPASNGASPTLRQQTAPIQHGQQLLSLEGFQILGEIGRGGMGVVYRALQHRLNRVVAIKMIVTGQLAGPEERVRFLMEGSLLARLSHPSFVQVHEVGTVELSAGTLHPYLVLEYVEGGSLTKKLAEAPFSPKEAAQAVLILARAMDAAHAHGIVHRDLKPANVLIAQDGTLKITDFGLAKELGTSGSLTPVGAAVGTPSYMAPEQAKGKPDVGPAVDIYALGAILYEMLGGRPPFVGDTPMAILLKVMDTPPAPISRLRVGVPRDLETICLKCLAKEPQRRYTRAGALADDLQAWLENRPIRARPVGRLERAYKWARRHPLPAALLLVLVLSLLAGSAISTYFGISAMHQADEKEKARADEEKARLASDRRAAELQLMAGQRLAADGEVDRGLFVMLRGWEKAPPQDEDLHRVFRRNIAAWLPHLPRLRCYIATARSTRGSVAFSDREIVYSDDKSVMVYDAANGKLQSPAQEFPGFGVAALSPDGKLVCLHTTDKDRFTYRAVERISGKRIGPDIIDSRFAELKRKFEGYRRFRFSADQAVLVREFVSPGADESQSWELATGTALGPPLQRPQGYLLKAPAEEGSQYLWLTTAGDGRIEIIDARTGKTLTGERQGLPSQTELPPSLFPHPDVVQRLADYVMWSDLRKDGRFDQTWRLSRAASFHNLSGDGRHVVSILGKQRLCWHDVAGQYVCVPTAGIDVNAWDSVASPDGRSCFYVRPYAFVKRMDFPRLLPAHGAGGSGGEGSFRELAPKGVNYGRAVFSPDRQSMLWAEVARTHRTSYARLTSTIDVRPIGLPMTDCDSKAAFSPSGRLVALATSDTMRVTNRMVRVYDARTGEPRSPAWPFTPFVHTLEFSPDERRLAIGHGGGGGAVVFDIDSTSPPVLLPQPGPVTRVLFSPDGRRLALAGRAHWDYSKPGVRVWDVATGKEAGVFVPMKDAPLLIADQGDEFFTIELDSGRRRRWSFASAAPVADLEPLADWPTVPIGRDTWTAHPVKRRLAAGSSHGAVWQWDLHTGKQLAPPADFRQPCVELEYSRNGDWLAVSGEDGDVGLFDSVTGKQAGPLLTQGMPLCGLAFTPDGSELLTALVDGRCIRWTLGKSEPLNPEQWRLWLEAATGMQLDGEMLLPLSVDEYQQRLERAQGLPVPLALPQAPASLWHAEEAQNAERAGQLNCALWHLDRWIGLEPKAWLPLAQRARIRALLGEVEAAKADLARATALSTDGDLANWRRHQAVLGRVTGQRLEVLK